MELERLSTPADADERVRAFYAAFNAREVDWLLDRMTPDVDWPNAWEGGRVTGRHAVRDYWTRQWAAIDPTVQPLGVVALDDGRIAVSVRQTVRDRDGAPLSEGRVTHVFSFSGGRISRMDVEEP